MTLYVLIHESGCGNPECCGDIDHYVEAVTDDIKLAEAWKATNPRKNTFEEFELNQKYGKSLAEHLGVK